MRRNKNPMTEWHRAKIVLWMICEYIREWNSREYDREEDELGEWGTSVEKLSLLGFQQRIGRKIPSEEEEEYAKPYSTNKNTLKSRRRRANKKKREYEDYIKQLRRMRWKE